MGNRSRPGVRALSGFILAVCCLEACSSAPEPRPAGETPPAQAKVSVFTDVTAEAGLAGTDPTWPDGTFAAPEISGPGLGLLDYDGDGDLDLLQMRCPPPGTPGAPAPNRLHRQEDDGTFRDVTEESGIGDPGFGQGLAVGDIDADGDLDVYFANYGPDAFYVNNGDGTFSERTAEAGFSGDRWSSSATFCDYDGDDDLDLFVVHYLIFEPKTKCMGPSGSQDYCDPANFYGVEDALWRNEGDGTFVDVTEASGIVSADEGRKAKGLGVVCADLTGDGRFDFFVANDGEPAHLWVQKEGGRFDEEAIFRGVAVSDDGVPEAGMGIGIGDVEGDGFLDLYVTHLFGENNRLYSGTDGLLFADRTATSRLALYDLPLTGFGCGFFDYDHDTDTDLAVVNGRVYRSEVLEGADAGEFWNKYAEPNLLLENAGSGSFENASGSASGFTLPPRVARGLAFGDVDGDGDLDLAASYHDATVRLFRNDAPAPGTHWLIVRAMTGKRDALGARVTVSFGDRTLSRAVLAGYSYMSSNDPRAHFGLGAADRVDAIEVVWPDGSTERFPGVAADETIVVHKGSGEPGP